MKRSLAAIAALTLTAPVLAKEPAHSTVGSHIDGYYSNLELELDAEGVESEDIDGDGGGIRFWMGNGWGVFTADVQTASMDRDVEGVDLDLDIDQIRAGLGARLLRRPNAEVWARGEYVQIKLDGDAEEFGSASEKQEGFGIHAGGMFGHGMIRGYAEIGYVEVEDADGLEYTAGVNIQPGMIGGFVEYRYSDLEIEDFDVDFTLSDIRVGVRVGF